MLSDYLLLDLDLDLARRKQKAQNSECRIQNAECRMHDADTRIAVRVWYAYIYNYNLSMVKKFC